MKGGGNSGQSPPRSCGTWSRPPPTTKLFLSLSTRVHTTWRSYPKLPYPGPGDRCYAANARLPSTRQDHPREREHPRASLD